MIPWRRWLSSRWIVPALGSAALVSFAMGGWQWFSARRFEKQRDEAFAATARAEFVADSVTKLDAARVSHIANLIGSARRSDSNADMWRRRAQATEATLARLAQTRDRLRDTLKLLTTGRDSLPVYVALVASLNELTEQLQTSLGNALRADIERKRAVDSLTLTHAIDSARYVGLELMYKTTLTALEKSQRALASAEGPCRLLPFVPCWSRKTVAVVFAGVGAVTTYVLTRKGGA